MGKNYFLFLVCYDILKDFPRWLMAQDQLAKGKNKKVRGTPRSVGTSLGAHTLPKMEMAQLILTHLRLRLMLLSSRIEVRQSETEATCFIADNLHCVRWIGWDAASHSTVQGTQHAMLFPMIRLPCLQHQLLQCRCCIYEIKTVHWIMEPFLWMIEDLRTEHLKLPLSSPKGVLLDYVVGLSND